MRQRRPVDLDGLRTVLGGLDRIGDHERNRVADVTHYLAGEDEIGRRLRIVAQRAGEARQRPQIGDVVAGENEPYAGHLPRRDGIDGEMRMGVRRTHHHGMERAVRRHVGDITPFAA